MAQITVPKAFDKQSLDPEVLKGVEPLVEYMNQNTDQVIRALFNQLTLSENFRGRIAELKALHRRSVTIESQGNGILAAILLKSDPEGVRSFTQTKDGSGRLIVTFTFDHAIPLRARSVTKSAPFATYEIQGSQTVQPGDRVTFSQYGTKANNGTFLVVGRDSMAVTVYHPAAIAETKAEYTGTSETEQVVSLYLFYT